jgi:IclR family transcriptional regulator, mhp operon transcriptional activator
VASFPPVNSVVRALDLLQAMNSRPASTIDELHGQTGIPKPSIVRLLQTLEGRGLVRRAPKRGAYCLTSGVRALSSGYHSEPKLIEIASPLLDEMTRRLKWPLGIAMPNSDAVVIQYSTIHLSPLSLLHSTVGLRLSLVSRAHGRAFLAFCDENEQEALIRILQKSELPEDFPAREDAAFRALLATIRSRGIATRHSMVRTVSNTLAVPVFEQSRVVGTVGLTFIASAMEAQEAIERYGADLRQLANNISALLDAPAGVTGPRVGGPGFSL